MTPSLRICIALLAAGQSQRFGSEDKLGQDLHGRMLGHHAARKLAGMEFSDRIAIVPPQAGACVPTWTKLGFQILTNPQARSGMGTSVALAASHARDIKADGLLICLADMPFVSAALLDQLVESFHDQGAAAIVCAADGDKRSPPALFGSRHFARLARLSGDSGAREIIAQAQVIAAAPDELADIDTREELRKWNATSLP